MQAGIGQEGSLGEIGRLTKETSQPGCHQRGSWHSRLKRGGYQQPQYLYRTGLQGGQALTRTTGAQYTTGGGQYVTTGGPQ